MKYAAVFLMLLGAVACKKDDEPKVENLGTFSGDLLVSVSNPAQSGSLLNSSVIITKTGNSAVVSVKATPNFDREYKGEVTLATQGTYSITLTQQSKPTEKTVAGTLVISTNALVFNIAANGDAVETIKDSKTVTVTGNTVISSATLVKK